ncbi:MAG: isoprenylcysteine carboxylmethyltransferase family protein [Ignavibacteria bacterium]|nr:isoprenylcysteine carboxylmethyltransferase family protein [Ignavibacteria bacterium]
MNSTKLIIFFTASIFLTWFSWWFSIKDKRYHGVYRFFAFESILILALLNIDVWFKNPLSINQIFSWVFLCTSLVLAIYGFYLLKYLGKPKGKFENTTELITTGLFRYIRHPLYCALLLLGLGIFLKDTNITTTFLVLVNSLALYLTAKTEEKEMIARFGSKYIDYMKRSKMFIPYLF